MADLASDFVAARLGRYIAGLDLAAVEDEVHLKTRTCLLDGLALGMAAGVEPTTRALLASPLLTFSDDGCRVWADGRRASLSDAVWLNGYAVHARFQDDCDMTSWTHPGSLVLPAALSVAEAIDAPLQRALAGIVSGYSVMYWLGAAEKVGHGAVQRAFRASPTLGPVGAAAAAAAVLQLPAEQAGHAVAIAACSAGGIIETVRSGSDDWRFQNGSAAWRGVQAALLAQSGARGPAQAFESEKGFVRAFAGLERLPDEMLGSPDPRSILTTWAKPYPILGDNVAVAAAALRLSDQVDDVGTIAAITLHQNAEFAAYPGTSYAGPFETATQAIASTAFNVASALARGSITFDLYEAALQDPVILSLVDKVTITAEDDFGYLDGRVTLETTDGRELVAECGEIPRTFFYRDAAAATAAFAGTLAEVGIGGDAAGFAARVLDAGFDPPTAEVISQAMALR